MKDKLTALGFVGVSMAMFAVAMAELSGAAGSLMGQSLLRVALDYASQQPLELAEMLCLPALIVAFTGLKAQAEDAACAARCAHRG
jgi:hypothetical protein